MHELFYEMRCSRCGSPYRFTANRHLVKSCGCPGHEVRCESERHYRVEEWTPEHFAHLSVPDGGVGAGQDI